MRLSVLAVAFVLAATSATSIHAQGVQPAGVPDKSLAPDGKPWTAESLIAYWKSRRPDLPMKQVDHLGLSRESMSRLRERVAPKGQPSPQPPVQPARTNPKEALKARRAAEIARRKAKATAKDKEPPRGKAEIVFADQPQSQAELLEKIEAKFGIEVSRTVIDLSASREAAYGSLRDGDLMQLLDDPNGRESAWTGAIELLDFQGNEEAAELYVSHIPVDHPCKQSVSRWYGVVFSGDRMYRHHLNLLLHGGQAYAYQKGSFLEARDEFGDAHMVKIVGYPGCEPKGN